MKKKDLSRVVALLIILIVTTGMINFQAAKASNTLVVPDQYPSISSAVNHASAGDTILVKSGVYHENLQINKSLTLEGQNSVDTIITGSGGSTPTAVLVLAADSIRVSGLTIESLNYSNTADFAYGIWVEGNNCTITSNIIENTYIGIFCSIQSSTTITQNTVTGSIKDGIRFYGGSLNTISDNNIVGNAVSGIAIDGYSNTITNNDIENNYRGVGLGASYSVLFGNTIKSNSESGVFLAGSYNIVSANDISNNKYGVYITVQLTAPSSDRVYHNNFVSNIYNAYDESLGLVESWDNGSQSGGNYWSDYHSRYPSALPISSSGIENIPYVINSNNTDNYPLAAPFNLSNLVSPPTAISPPVAKPNSVVASWSFNTVDSSLVTPDTTGDNPAVLGSETAAYNYTPAMVPSKFGEALNFTGNVYAVVHTSPSLETSNDVTIDAWINVQAIKDVPYNNIFIEALRTTASLPTRTLGLAINGEEPQNSSSPPQGALRGYVVTPSGLNEIDTKVALPLNTWVHVVFTRSTTTGMHIYVNGKEQAVIVVAGTANPKGPIQNPTNIYIGHDSMTEIDQLQISNFALQQPTPLGIQWWLWAIVFIAALASGLVLYIKRFKQQK